jgi:hypothetical protein
MKLSRNFSLAELIKSDTAIRHGIDNNPNADQIEKLKLLCENILQPVRDHFGRVTVTSCFRSPELCVKINSSSSTLLGSPTRAGSTAPGLLRIHVNNYYERIEKMVRLDTNLS